MCAQGLDYGLRSDLEAATKDHVVGAAVDLEVSIVIEIREITCGDPCFARTACLRRGDLQPARLTRIEDYAVVVDDLQPHPGERSTYAALLDDPARVEVLDRPAGYQADTP